MSVSLGINWRNVEMYGDDKNVTPLFGCTIIPRIYYDTSQSVIPNFKLVSSMVASAYLSLRACFLLKIAEREDNFLASHYSHRSYRFQANWAPGKLGPERFLWQIGPRQIGPPADWAPENFGFGKLGPWKMFVRKIGPLENWDPKVTNTVKLTRKYSI